MIASEKALVDAIKRSGGMPLSMMSSSEKKLLSSLVSSGILSKGRMHNRVAYFAT